MKRRGCGVEGRALEYFSHRLRGDRPVDDVTSEQVRHGCCDFVVVYSTSPDKL